MTALRIVSLVPSITELVFALGRGDALVGRTRFCTEPSGPVDAVSIIGGTKNPRIDRIIALAPDTVLANKEENRREDIEALRAAGIAVLLTDPNSVPEAMSMISEVGALLGAEPAAAALVSEIGEALDAPAPTPPVRFFAAVWWNPMMGLGSASYGHDLLERSGGSNVLSGQPRYPEVSLEELAELRPELILLPDEPFPFAASHLPTFKAVALTRVIDGKLLWWYGPRIPEALRALRAIFAESGGT